MPNQICSRARFFGKSGESVGKCLANAGFPGPRLTVGNNGPVRPATVASRARLKRGASAPDASAGPPRKDRDCCRQEADGPARGISGATPFAANGRSQHEAARSTSKARTATEVIRERADWSGRRPQRARGPRPCFYTRNAQLSFLAGLRPPLMRWLFSPLSRCL
jgi:hypothetical protein